MGSWFWFWFGEQIISFLTACNSLEVNALELGDERLVRRRWRDEWLCWRNSKVWLSSWVVWGKSWDTLKTCFMIWCGALFVGVAWTWQSRKASKCSFGGSFIKRTV